MELKEQLLAELKKNYEGRLTSKFTEQLADRLAGKVEKAEDIQGVINELENAPVKIQDLQSEGDRRAKELSNRIKELESELTKKKETPPEPPPSTPPDNLFNTVMEEMKQLRAEVQQQKQEKAAEKAKQLLLTKLEGKKIPRVLIEDANPQSAEDVDEIIQKAEAKFEQLKKDIGVVAGEEPPRRGDPAAEQRKVIDDIKRITKTIK